ncbi:hypothetical protein ABT298_16615, partial [Streptomyces sp. NPDC001034]
MRSLPLPLALTARLTPVAVLACAGWALSAGPAAPRTSASGPRAEASTPDTSSAAGRSGRRGGQRAGGGAGR